MVTSFFNLSSTLQIVIVHDIVVVTVSCKVRFRQADFSATFSFLRKSKQNTVHTCNIHVSRTDKQHLSRPQTTTSIRSGYTTGECNQLFPDTQSIGPGSHPAIVTVPRNNHLVTKLNKTKHKIGR